MTFLVTAVNNIMHTWTSILQTQMYLFKFVSRSFSSTSLQHCPMLLYWNSWQHSWRVCECSHFNQGDIPLIMVIRQGQWHNAYDCQLTQEIIFQVYPHLFSEDNPMQAELCSNVGSMSQFWCCSDFSGGTKEERETDEGYNSLYQVCGSYQTMRQCWLISI